MSSSTRLCLIAALMGLTTVAASRKAAAQQVQAQAPTRELRGLSVSLVVTNGRRFGDGYRLFDRDGGENGGAGEVTHDVTSLAGSGMLAVGLGIQGEDYESSAIGQAKLETWAPYAIAIARFRTAATFQPYVGVAAGVEFGDLVLNPSPSNLGITSDAWGVFGRASLGLRCAPRRLIVRGADGQQLFALALALELAGTVGTPLAFEYQAQPPSQGAGDSDRIPTGTVPLGSVSRQALQGRGLISVVF
jgi:hypothetical protein